jgi:phosphonate transport system ATP-binding protein
MLKLNGVSVTYPGDIRALRPTSLAFGAGQFTVLLGPSGAGKSTLLRCLNGLVAPSAGRVAADGVGDIAGRHALAGHRRRTGMIFQQHQLIGRLSALRNVLTGRLGYHGQLRTLLPLPRADRLIALECLDRVGLLDRALDRVDTLSGGMQQRVGIARALAQRPRLILADEPVASLDPATAAKVLELLHTICKADGITAIVSLHQVELALEVADRIVGIAHGAVVFDGPAAAFNAAQYRQIYEKPLPAKEAAAHAPPLRRPILATREV